MENRDKLKALAWEARRRGTSYGALAANLTPAEEQRIYKAWERARDEYMEKLAQEKRRKEPPVPWVKSPG